MLRVCGSHGNRLSCFKYGKGCKHNRMANSSRAKSRRNMTSTRTGQKSPRRNRQVSSEEAIKAGEQIAMAAFASGLKLAAAFGTVAAKTAGLALTSLASGANKFSELVKEEARRPYNTRLDGQQNPTSRKIRDPRNTRRKKSAS
jgi:hypothetical protein